MNRHGTIKRKKSLRDYCEAKRKREHEKTPVLKRKTSFAAKPRKALKKVSSARQRENATYLRNRVDFLRRFPICVACLTRGISPTPSCQVHHARGRVHRLLLDERFWIAVCAECHEWIHDHARTARELGLLAPIAEFNVFPR